MYLGTFTLESAVCMQVIFNSFNFITLSFISNLQNHTQSTYEKNREEEKKFSSPVCESIENH
jgi:hypothetical protein